MYFKRKIDEFLIQWKQDSAHKPLIIKGARQIGKTESIVHFANEQYANVIYINFVLEILKYYQNRSGNTSTLEFQRYLDKLLNTSPSSDCVTLSSVHKAKGLEADNVFVLNEGKVCFDPRNSPELQQQEKNLSYISLTRAKNKMYLVKEPSAQNTKRG